MFIVSQPCLGIIGMLSEERVPPFHQWAAGRTDSSTGEHTRHGIQWGGGEFKTYSDKVQTSKGSN